MKPAVFVKPTGAELKRAALLSLFTTLVCLAWPVAALAQQAFLQREILLQPADAQERLGRAADVVVQAHDLLSMADRRPSDRMLKEMEVMKIISPGRAATQGWT